MRIAICISGQARQWKTGYQSLKTNLLDKLPYAYDIFISTWKPSEEIKIDLNSGWRYKDEGTLDQYEFLYCPVVFEVDEYDKWMDNWFVDKERESKLSRKDNYPRRLFAMWYKVKKCHQLAVERGRLGGFQYDLVIRTRSDLEYGNNFDINCLDISRKDDKILVDHYGNGSSANACGDVFSIGTMGQMNYYCSMYDKMLEYFKKGHANDCQSLADYHMDDVPHEIIHFVRNVYRPTHWTD